MELFNAEYLTLLLWVINMIHNQTVMSDVVCIYQRCTLRSRFVSSSVSFAFQLFEAEFKYPRLLRCFFISISPLDARFDFRYGSLTLAFC
ncbi:hypothetical protein KY284_001284 [Solanum tuberosum]|nr:hypothetical protein KY284_001284 [Solanum tuberosum]